MSMSYCLIRPIPFCLAKEISELTNKRVVCVLMHPLPRKGHSSYRGAVNHSTWWLIDCALWNMKRNISVDKVNMDDHLMFFKQSSCLLSTRLFRYMSTQIYCLSNLLDIYIWHILVLYNTRWRPIPWAIPVVIILLLIQLHPWTPLFITCGFMHRTHIPTHLL